MAETLFIVKKNHGYDGGSMSSGLKNSVKFVADMLIGLGYDVALAVAIDGNSIDALVAKYCPKRVILEAIWVAPGKLEELIRLHPNVAWTVRVHSETPFLANEGMACEWIAWYMRLGVEVAFNSEHTQADFRLIGTPGYLPNYYPLSGKSDGPLPWKKGDVIHIGCFGAIRPLKNQLIQAMAAITFAREIRCRLVFHMNGDRVEQGGTNNLKNIVAVCRDTGTDLVLHPWMNHCDFLSLVAKMNICLQVSMSESFNVTAADAVSQMVPVVGSDAIPWLPVHSCAQVNSRESIVSALHRASRKTAAKNYVALRKYSDESAWVWKRWMAS